MDLSIGNIRLESFAWKPWLGNLRLINFVWVFVAISWVQTQTKLRHHLLDVGTIRLEFSLGNFRLGTLAWKLRFGNFRLGTFVDGYENQKQAMKTFVDGFGNLNSNFNLAVLAYSL